MDSTGDRSDDSPAIERDLSEQTDPSCDRPAEASEKSWLGEIADQLESDPQECWQALESLATVEPDLRLSIIDELSGLGARPAPRRCFACCRRHATRRHALRPARPSSEWMATAGLPLPLASVPPSTLENQETGSGRCDAAGERSLLLPVVPDRSRPRLVRCLVTPLDGLGRGSLVVSVNQADQRRTAAFLCDVRLGIRDVVGEVEPESPRAGGLIDALDQQPEAGCVRDVPELALGLLAGSLMLCWHGRRPAGARLARTVRSGPGFSRRASPRQFPAWTLASVPQAEMPGRAAGRARGMPLVAGLSRR